MSAKREEEQEEEERKSFHSPGVLRPLGKTRPQISVPVLIVAQENPFRLSHLFYSA